MQEVVNYSLSDVKGLENAGLSHLAQMKPLKVANPLRVEQEYLRLSLRPGLLANVEHNKKYHHGPLLMFEAGKVYIPRNRVLPEEQEVLAGVVTGDPDDPMDGFLRAKGVLEMMLGRLGVETQFERGEGEGLHPGRVVQVSVRGERLAVLGEVHPQVLEAFDIEGASVHVFEVDMDRLLAHLPATKRYRPVSRYPGALRDSGPARRREYAVDGGAGSDRVVLAGNLGGAVRRLHGGPGSGGQEIAGVPGAVPVAEQDAGGA